MTPRERQLLIFSYYRDAELRGARLLLNLLNHFHDRETVLKLSRQLADETRHALLWTLRITALGAAPLPVEGYQTRLGMRLGLPKRLSDLLALTVVVEERAQRRYREHAALPEVDAETLGVLNLVSQDEEWHLAWMGRKLREMGDEQATDLLGKYRILEVLVYDELEREVFESV